MGDFADVNIEFGHMYAADEIGPEHKRGTELADSISRRLVAEGQIVTHTCLVDDYNSHNPDFSEVRLIDQLLEYGGRLDYIVYESRLTSWAEEVAAIMDGKGRKQYRRLLRKSDRVPCSMLVAIWHLLRLGLIDGSHDERPRLVRHGAPPFEARRIITVLPRYYREVEERALRIILATPYRNHESRIEHVFF